MKNKIYCIVAAVFICLFVIYLLFKQKDSLLDGVRCTAHSRIDLSVTNGSGPIVDASFNIQLNKDKSFLLINGMVESFKSNYIIERQIELIFPQKDKKDGSMYQIQNINKSKNDNVPDDIFFSFLSIFSGDSSHVYINAVPLADDLYMIGGPYSNVLICKKY